MGDPFLEYPYRVFTFLPKINGSVRYVYNHARKLAERGHNVYLIARKMDGTPAYENIGGIQIIRASPSFGRNSFWNKIGLFLSQETLIVLLHRKVKFHIIHSHGTDPCARENEWRKNIPLPT